MGLVRHGVRRSFCGAAIQRVEVSKWSVATDLGWSRNVRFTPISTGSLVTAAKGHEQTFAAWASDWSHFLRDPNLARMTGAFLHSLSHTRILLSNDNANFHPHNGPRVGTKRVISRSQLAIRIAWLFSGRRRRLRASIFFRCPTVGSERKRRSSRCEFAKRRCGAALCGAHYFRAAKGERLL